MRPLLFTIFLLLMMAGNVFAAVKLITSKQTFFEQSPRLTETGFTILQIIPFVNLAALAGLWFYQSWAAWLAIAAGLAIIVLDIRFGIWYHLYVAVPSLGILLYFIIRYWNQFK